MIKAARLFVMTFGFFLCSILAFSQNADFSGTWVLNFEKSKLEDMPEGLTGSIFKIKHDGDKVKLTLYHLFGERRRKISFKMLADGKTRRVKLIFKGKLEKKDPGLQATLLRKDFLNIVNYRFGVTQNELVADEVFTGKPRDHHSVWIFDRENLK
jgi:hypothetical protein